MNDTESLLAILSPEEIKRLYKLVQKENRRKQVREACKRWYENKKAKERAAGILPKKTGPKSIIDDFQHEYWRQAKRRSLEKKKSETEEQVQEPKRLKFDSILRPKSVTFDETSILTQEKSPYHLKVTRSH